MQEHSSPHAHLVKLARLLPPPLPQFRAPGGDVEALHSYVIGLVESINKRFRSPGYEPVVWLERPVPLYERIALYSIADVAVVTATRDGMNLMAYEYVVCRQGPVRVRVCGGGGGFPGTSMRVHGPGARCTTPSQEVDTHALGKLALHQPPTQPNPPNTTMHSTTDLFSPPGWVLQAPPSDERRRSMLVVSEFVGCSPSLSGAIRVSPQQQPRSCGCQVAAFLPTLPCCPSPLASPCTQACPTGTNARANACAQTPANT